MNAVGSSRWVGDLIVVDGCSWICPVCHVERLFSSTQKITSIGKAEISTELVDIKLAGGLSPCCVAEFLKAEPRFALAD